MDGRVAIVGAGMAGLSAARVLRHAGVACTLFDKSRGLGGRMATRRAGDLQFDHGAQYFTARGEGFRALVADWAAQGSAAQWFDGAFVGAPGMTAPARAMAQHCEVIAGCEVKALRRCEDGRWTLVTAAGDVNAGPFSAVILALPGPQIEPIAASAGVSFTALAGVRYTPCWALMLAFDGRMDLPWTHLRAEGADAAWIARDATKPGRSGPHETFVIHASAEWSRRHLERTPEWAAAELLRLFAQATGVTQAPVFAVAHRWRYALVEVPAGAPFLWDEAARIGACGDWCIGPRVEAAFDSGEAMAHAALKSWGEHNGR
ncbi:MAG: NAD(P)-binding protein [Beijerinckiaceae bacterium]|nr:NAD(P)-binding protein [Beijerinckiaceae bacterium]